MSSPRFLPHCIAPVPSAHPCRSCPSTFRAPRTTQPSSFDCVCARLPASYGGPPKRGWFGPNGRNDAAPCETPSASRAAIANRGQEWMSLIQNKPTRPTIQEKPLVSLTPALLNVLRALVV